MKFFVVVSIVLGLLFAPTVFAAVLDEQSLTDAGYSPIAITGNQTECQTITIPSFDIESDVDDVVLTLHPEFNPVTETDANVSIYLGSDPTPYTSFFTRDIFPETGDVHVFLPQEVAEEGSAVSICANGSNSLQTLNVSSEGMIGLYHQPRFNEPGSFATIIAGENPKLGEEIAVQVKVHNDGGEAVFVKVDYRKYQLDYIPLLKGETGFEDTIQPGETKIITYHIKPLRGVSILLPPAIMTYENIFGETVTLESTRAYLNVAAPEFNVKGAFLVPKNRITVNEAISVRWVAQNEGIETLQGLNAQFSVSPAGNISPSTLTIPEISPSNSASQNFTLAFAQPGTYTLECVLSPAYDPSITTNCQSAVIEVVEDNWGITLLFSLLLLGIAIAVYAYIYILPERKREEPPRAKHGRFHHFEK